MAEKPRYRALASIDPQELAEFQAGIRKRYTDEQIVAEIVACAQRLGRSPTMREFAADSETAVHPQTVIEHFGSWNAAKRAAGLVPRRFATRESSSAFSAPSVTELGRPPTARDIDEHKGRLPSKSLYWHTFGSLTTALREAGFDVPVRCVGFATTRVDHRKPDRRPHRTTRNRHIEEPDMTYRTATATMATPPSPPPYS